MESRANGVCAATTAKGRHVCEEIEKNDNKLQGFKLSPPYKIRIYIVIYGYVWFHMGLLINIIHFTKNTKKSDFYRFYQFIGVRPIFRKSVY